MKVYGDSRSGNCYKIQLLLGLLGKNGAVEKTFSRLWCGMEQRPCRDMHHANANGRGRSHSGSTFQLPDGMIHVVATVTHAIARPAAGSMSHDAVNTSPHTH